MFGAVGAAVGLILGIAFAAWFGEPLTRISNFADHAVGGGGFGIGLATALAAAQSRCLRKRLISWHVASAGILWGFIMGFLAPLVSVSLLRLAAVALGCQAGGPCDFALIPTWGSVLGGLLSIVLSETIPELLCRKALVAGAAGGLVGSIPFSVVVQATVQGAKLPAQIHIVLISASLSLFGAAVGLMLAAADHWSKG